MDFQGALSKKIKTLEPLKNKLRSKFEVVASVVMTLCTTTVMKATADTTQ